MNCGKNTSILGLSSPLQYLRCQSLQLILLAILSAPSSKHKSIHYNIILFLVFIIAVHLLDIHSSCFCTLAQLKKILCYRTLASQAKIKINRFKIAFWPYQHSRFLALLLTKPYKGDKNLYLLGFSENACWFFKYNKALSSNMLWFVYTFGIWF